MHSPGRIIALTGLAGSGKSTVAEIIGGPQVAFAEPLKRFCGEVFGFTHEQLWGPSSKREEPSAHFTRPTGEPLTPRYALQTLGTEWGRNCDEDVWAKSGVQRALRLLEGGAPYIVITDLRFANEARLVREAGGEVWRIHRPGLSAAPHPSELEVWGPAMGPYVTCEILNEHSIEHLRLVVTDALALLSACADSTSIGYRETPASG